ncbi:sigma-54 dependent transcriptional regulator [Methylomonas sp. AM2-LC]|uniref:sigma-54 interaction domain-containing protein n=1 Tax=Methylomonas sp. AM2-LC TaxID=3153301 RepID=UPI003266EC8E
MSNFKAFIGQSPIMADVINSARIVSSSDVTVLITGETGTGKEVLAHALQQESSRRDKAFITLNCAALPESLVESELFGHKKGAFTGATADKEGLLKAANGGTLFLDEINSLSLPIQGKLLRFLESGEYMAVGDTKTHKLNVRILAATNTDLNKEILQGTFRQDLYFRLNVIPIELPPLRERLEDIEALTEHFFSNYAKTHALPVAKFSPSSLQSLTNYPWPGNIRELRNLCERFSILMSGKTIETDSLPPEIIKHSLNVMPSSFNLPSDGVKLDTLLTSFIQQALQRSQGNYSKSAKLLGISRFTLYYRLRKMSIDTPKFSD